MPQGRVINRGEPEEGKLRATLFREGGKYRKKNTTRGGKREKGYYSQGKKRTNQKGFGLLQGTSKVVETRIRIKSNDRGSWHSSEKKKNKVRRMEHSKKPRIGGVKLHPHQLKRLGGGLQGGFKKR